MTIIGYFANELHQRGLFEDQIAEVMQNVMESPENESMKSRWNDNTEDYPPILLLCIWLSVKSKTLEYIDNNIPKAWFRPLFEN